MPRNPPFGESAVTAAYVLSAIAEVAEALCDPRQHHEPIYDVDRHRNKRLRRVWSTVQPGLIQQLRDAIRPGSATIDGEQFSGSAGYRSAPPLQMEAASKYMVIAIGATRWCWSLELDIRDTAEGNVRALVGAAGNMDDETGRTLLDEMRQWRTWAAVMTGWQSPLYAPHVPCPNPECGQSNSLRVNLSAKRALCNACNRVWGEDDGAIFILADYIRLATEAA